MYIPVKLGLGGSMIGAKVAVSRPCRAKIIAMNQTMALDEFDKLGFRFRRIFENILLRWDRT